MKIVYMGTPDFAVAPLKKLVDEGKEIVGVVTMPDKPAGRGHKLQYSPIKQYAIENNLPLLQPTNLKDPEFIEDLKSLHADLQIVVAFRMLPESVWSMPPLGTFNLHASLLPQYRGAAPINWAIINGDTESGITTFFLKHEIDTGDIIMQESVEITSDDNAGSLHDKLMALGANLVLLTVEQIEKNKVQSIPQPERELRPAPKIFKNTCHLNFNHKSIDIHNMVRGLSPYPAAWISLCDNDGNTTNMKIYSTAIEVCTHSETVGTIITDGKKTLKIATLDGYIHLCEVQLAGKKRMNAADLMRGTDLTKYKINIQ